MSYISVALDELIKEHKMTRASLCRAAHLSEPHISRIQSGDQIWVSPAHIYSLAVAFCPNTNSERFVQIHAKILFARLRDTCTGPGARLIELDLLSKEPSFLHDGHPSDTEPPLAPRLQDDLKTITKYVSTDRDVRSMVSTIAKLCRRKPLSQPDSK